MATCRSIVTAALLVGAAGQGQQPCPEPVAALLNAGQLWGLEVHEADCTDGDPSFHAVTPTGDMYGEWGGFCTVSMNVDLIITTEPHGLGGACSTDGDCASIPCDAKCIPCTDEGCRHSFECMSVGDNCRNRTFAQISPSNFEAACPPDPRDSVCMEGLSHFEDMGCGIFFDDWDLSLPPTAEMRQVAMGCSQLLGAYAGCISGNFSADAGYLQRRMPPAEVFAYIAAAAGASPNGNCVMVPRSLAAAMGAVPCGAR